MKANAAVNKQSKMKRKKRRNRTGVAPGRPVVDVTVIEEGVGKTIGAEAVVAATAATVLTRNGYGLLVSNKTVNIKKIKKDLMVGPRTIKGYGSGYVRKYPVYRQSSRRLYVPRHYGLRHFGDVVGSRIRPGAKAPRLRFSGSLRPLQVNAADKFMATIAGDDSAPTRRHPHGGILSLYCGAGKTVVALNLAARVGRKTLVVVHKEFLMHQWHERIKTFLPGAKVGLIQQKTVDVEGKDIVLAMLQSIAVRDYPAEVMRPFGLVIFDECHHLSSEVFSRCLPKIGARVTLGLSATPDRKDGLTKVFKWYLGDILFEKQRPRDETVVSFVRTVRLNSTAAGYGELLVMRTGTANTAAMINNIAEFAPRTALIAALAVAAVRRKRQILVLSGRRQHLDDIHRAITTGPDALELEDVGYYVGGMNQNSLQRSEKCSVVLATFHMAAEGLDIKSLNTLLLATPMSGVTQAVGRILRDVRKEFPPCIIDIVDHYSVFVRQAQARRRVYKKQGFSDVVDLRVLGPPGQWAKTVPSLIDFTGRAVPPLLRGATSPQVVDNTMDHLFSDSSDDESK